MGDNTPRSGKLYLAGFDATVSLLSTGGGTDNQITNLYGTGTNTLTANHFGISTFEGRIGGTIAPGNSPGTLTIQNNVSFLTGSSLDIEIAGTSTGQFDVLNVLGTVSLGNASLDITPINGFLVQTGMNFQIVTNDGTDAVLGTFAGMAEGGFFHASDGQYWQITYLGGTGNDIVLTAVPEPATWALFGVTALGGTATYLWRRRQKQSKFSRAR